MTPIRIRGPVWGAVTVIVVGALTLFVGPLTGEVWMLGTGALLLALGIGSLAGCYLVVRDAEVQVRNGFQMTIPRIPIHGVGDLRLDGNRLVRAGDGKRIGSVGPMAARREDADQLRAAIAGAAAR